MGSTSNLKQLSQVMEEEFLALGERLYQFRDQSRGISIKADEVASRINGSDLAEVMEVLRRFRIRVGGIEGESDRGTSVLARILDRFNEIGPSLQSLVKVAKFLDIICVIMKIENSRFQSVDTGFNTTAQSLKDLGKVIRAKSEDLEARSVCLVAAIRQNLETIEQSEQHQSNQAHVILDQILASLERLQDTRRASADMSQNLSVRYQAISRSIGDIVASLQYHDITRQRVEHSVKALAKVEQTLASPAQAAQQRDLVEAIAIVRIQSAQLNHTNEDLKKAVHKIQESLNSLIREINEIVSKTQDLSGQSDQSCESFLGDIEKKLSFLRNAAIDYTRVNSEIESAMTSVTGTADEVSTFAREITQIGTSMRIVAMNASVNAAGIGAEGSSLGVLAKHTCELASETEVQIHQVAEALRTIAALSQSLGGNTSGSAISPLGDAGELDGEIGEIEKQLLATDKYAGDGLMEMKSQSRDLLSAVSDSISSLKSPTEFANAIHAVCADLEEFLRMSSRIYPDAFVQSASLNLHDLEISYTMKRERDVHQSVLGPAGSAGEIQFGNGFGNKIRNNDPIADNAGQFGSNVDLF
jgi:methyl-accepting chemotaxis protein